MLSIEEIKQLNMVQFLTHHYGLKFSAKADRYVCLSPFSDEKEPSFVVGLVEDHWLFKDFSSGYGGSLIDFVLLKEGFDEVCQALSFIGNLVSGVEKGSNSVSMWVEDNNDCGRCVSYNISDIYRKLLANDAAICGKYLSQRGIDSGLITELLTNGILVHNHYQGESYCCFAVFNHHGELCCLDNHQIGGRGKFVLGKKSIFSRDWHKLASAHQVFICEGIIDYLSIKSLEGGGELVGIALLGTSVCFEPGLLQSARKIVSGLDGDEGGLRGFLDLQERFPDKEFSVYDFGEYKDANEYLQSIKSQQRVARLTARQKLSLYKEFMSSGNKSQVARKWGINRSYMYQVVQECEEMILGGFSQRRWGRKATHAPSSLPEAINQIEQLEQEKRSLEEEKEKYYAQSEFLKVRLKWAQREGAEIGSGLDNDKQPTERKKHLKKKRRQK